MNYYYKVIPRVSLPYFGLGIIGLGLLFSFFPATDSIWMGYIAVGVMLNIAYKWKLIEGKNEY